MNKQEFANYIAENFRCSCEAAEAIITIFSESLANALSESHKVELDTLGEFKICNIPEHNIYSFKRGKTISIKERKAIYFKPAYELKLSACY